MRSFISGCQSRSFLGLGCASEEVRIRHTASPPTERRREDRGERGAIGTSCRRNTNYTPWKEKPSDEKNEWSRRCGALEKKKNPTRFSWFSFFFSPPPPKNRIRTVVLCWREGKDDGEAGLWGVFEGLSALQVRVSPVRWRWYWCEEHWQQRKVYESHYNDSKKERKLNVLQMCSYLKVSGVPDPWKRIKRGAVEFSEKELALRILIFTLL